MSSDEHSLPSNYPPRSQGRAVRAGVDRDGESVGGLFYGSESQDDGSINFWQVLTVLRKWWWLIILFAIVATAFTALRVSRITPLYDAQSSLQIKQEERNITGTDSIQAINADREFLNTQVELLQSGSLATTVIDSLNLMSDRDFLEGVSSPAQDNVVLTREQKLRRVMEVYNARLSVTPVESSRLINLRFIHSDPRKAALIANTISENFINNDLQRKYNATSDARTFLEDRLKTVKASLAEAERELVTYASDNEIILIGGDNSDSGSLDKGSLVTLSEQLTQATTARQKAEQAYANVGQEAFALEVLNNAPVNRLKEQRIALNSIYIEKLAVYKPDFPEMLELKARIDLFDQTIAAETDKIIAANSQRLKDEYNVAKAQEASLSRRVNVLKSGVVDLRERSIEYTILKRQVDTERTQYDGLLQRLKEISVSDDIGTSLVEIVDYAMPAERPFKPNKNQALALALILSTALGFAIAFAIELIDDRIKQPEHIKTKLGMVIMGVTPYVKESLELTSLLRNPQASIAEAYAALRANLQFSAMNGGPRTIQITSTQPGEGKSVTALGLAMRYAGLGEKTLLIDADMRRPTFVIEDKAAIGLSGLLTKNTHIAKHITITDTPNLHVITSGSAVPNPSEILSSARFDEILAYARETYAYVVVDSPPVIGLADAPILGAKVDASLLVVETNRLRTRNVKAAIERLSISGTRLLGVVLTKYKAPKSGYSYYKYYGQAGTDYSQDTPDKKRPKAPSKQKFNLG